MHFEDHLTAPRGLGALADWPHAGAAGGAACGDLVRVAVRVEGDRIAEAGFDAKGCGAALAAGSAVVELIEGEPFLAAARLTPDDVANALGGLIAPKRHAADPRGRRASPRPRRRRQGGRRAAAPGLRRTLVAMSGGVDSAAAAQLALDAGDEVLAVTLELWSDPATDGERSCCSPQAVTGARALAHRMGIPHVTLDVRERFRAEVVDGFIDGYAAGRTPNPCVRCNGAVRFDAMLELAERLGAARLATGHYARIARDEHGAADPPRHDPRKDQSYMLAKLDPGALDRSRSRSAGLTKDAVRALAAMPGCRSPTSARARTSASWPGSAGAPSCAATAARGCARPARSSTPPAACWAATRASTSSPSASGAGSTSAPRSPSTCSARTPPPTA